MAMKATLPVGRAASSSLTPAKRNRDGIDREHLVVLLRRHFGHSDFRGLQFDAIEAVLSGRDCFCLMPTGAGKSICYQIPALAKTGIVLVVSPLIALMENQVAALKLQKIPAEFLSSTQSTATKMKIYEDLESGMPSLKLLYVTPELVSTSGFIEKLKKIHGRGLLTLVAIDEAHCISSWGHDFRPSYRNLSAIRNALAGIPILALTATAAKKVQQDVVRSLCLHRPCILVSSFNRSNIFYEVRFKDLLKSAYDDLRDTIMQAPTECSIIYCHARATCDEVGTRLRRDGVSCRVYHAGLSDKVRSQALEEWTSGKVPVVVATVAFGMGIDRKDVRMVCHFNLPKSLEAFYQESGRAGRDGKPARSVLYYSIEDRKTMEYIIKSSHDKQKAQRENGANELLQKNVEAFQKVVAYCEEATCRRRQVLEHFGEQVSPYLCAKTCDACKWPQRLSASLKELADVPSLKHGGWPSVLIQTSASVEKSEFWNYEDDLQEEAEEEISSSDDEEAQGLAVAAASKGGAKVERRLDALLRAEAEFSARQQGSNKHEKNQSAAQKKVVDQELRDSALRRLESVVQQAVERLRADACSASATAAAAVLEAEAYKKYGKSGRTFYNSHVASTVRWLSSCSPDELRARLAVSTFS